MKKAKLKIALPYLYPGKNSGQGVFEETFATRLAERGAKTKVFYPTNKELRKIPKFGTVLTMSSLREHYEELKEYDVIYCTNGSAISLLDGELSKKIVPTYHSTGYTIWQRIHVDQEKLPDFDNYKKYYDELDKIALVKEEVSADSLEAWGLCGIQMAKNAKNIVAVSENIKKELVAFGANPNKITVIENGIEKQWFEPTKECKKCDTISQKWSDKPVVIWMGRVGRDHLNFKIKGVDRILEVMSRLDSKKVHKVAIGITPKEQPWHEKAYAQVFEKRGIEFIPNCPYEHLPHLAKKGNVMLMTSRYEACQLSLIEAMASGMAPVSYNIGVAPEAVQNNKNGYIVKNIDEMTKKVSYLIDHPETMAKFGQAAKETATQKHQIDDMIDKYFEVFERVAKKN